MNTILSSIFVSLGYVKILFAIGKAELIFGGIAIVGVVAIIWQYTSKTGGKGLIYSNLQQYGPDHYLTTAAVENVANKIIRKEGFTNVYVTGVHHEVGNRYEGTFLSGTEEHYITIYTDGWSVSYYIDDGDTKPWK